LLGRPTESSRISTLAGEIPWAPSRLQHCMSWGDFFSVGHVTCVTVSCWWFQTFFIVHNIWDNPYHWLIFFKMVKTTNLVRFHVVFFFRWLLGKDSVSGKYMIYWRSENLGSHIATPQKRYRRKLIERIISISVAIYTSIFWGVIRGYMFVPSPNRLNQPGDRSVVQTLWLSARDETRGDGEIHGIRGATWPKRSSKRWVGDLPSGKHTIFLKKILFFHK
jgi:hypothetical protein